MLTAIIPALNAAAALGGTLSALSAGNRGPLHIVVADGGSADATRSVAAAKGARVITAPAGRGQQLAAGADAALQESGGVAPPDWLLFLHADTRLPREWRAAADAFMADPQNICRAGYFRYTLDDTGNAARRLEAVVRWRVRLLALPYGDQGLLISRRFYRQLGGYAHIPLMEDVDMVRRIGRRRLVQLEVNAVTSADRYRRDGYVRRALRNALCLVLYAAGVSPRWLLPLKPGGLAVRGKRTSGGLVTLQNHLVACAREPRIGRVKRRLAADIGAVPAWHFYHSNLRRVLNGLSGNGRWRCWLAITPDAAAASQAPWPQGWHRIPQGGGDLGARMARAAAMLPPGPVLIIGTDAPGIRVQHIEAGFRALGRHDAVIGPAADGGYWLIGFRRRPRLPNAFQGVRWSSPHALEDTLRNLRGSDVAMLDILEDVDDGAGFSRWRQGSGLAVLQDALPLAW